MEHKRHVNDRKETTRIEMFSDGVFAIAITLLVLELIGTLHPESDESLLNSLVHHWHSLLAFAIGFITILVCWINHHVALECIHKVDTNFMWINGFLLFVVTLTPFPTAILAEYLEKEQTIALAVYGFNYILISIAADGICTYAYNRHLVDEDCREYYSAYKIIYRYAIYFNIVAFALCFVSTIIPIILYTILFAFFAAPKEFASRLHRIRIGKVKKQSE